MSIILLFLKGPLKQKISFQHRIIYGLTKRKKERKTFEGQIIVPKNDLIVIHMRTFNGWWTRVLWWVDARFIVGGRTFYCGWTQVFWWWFSLYIAACEIDLQHLLNFKEYEQYRNNMNAKVNIPKLSSYTDQSKFVCVLMCSKVTSIVGQFVINVFDHRPHKL